MGRKIVPVYTDWDQVGESLKAIADIDNRMAIEEAKMNQDIDRIKTRTVELFKPLLEQKELLEKNIAQFTKSKVSEFIDSKTKKFTFGSVGFRKSTEIVTKNVKAIIGALKNNMMLDCITVKETINKDELAKYEDAALEKIGAKRKTEDKYYYEINKERIED